MPEFLHGVETQVLQIGPKQIKAAKSSVIVLVGIAPKGGDRNIPKLVASDADAQAYGKELPGFDLPQAIKAIRGYGAGTLFVVNTFDPETNFEAVTSEECEVEDFKFKLAAAPIIDDVVLKSETVTVTNATNATPIVLTSSADHGFVDGMSVTIASVGGNTNANGTYYVKKLTSTTFSLYTDEALTTGRAGNAAYTSGGTAIATYTKDVDYICDDFGNIEVIRPLVIAEGSTVLATYKRLAEPEEDGEVTAAQIVGELDTATNLRTGLECLDILYTTYGVTPKIIVCPSWNTNTTVKAAMAVKAAKWRAIYLLDVAASTLPGDVIIQRGPSGTTNITTTDKRAKICYPRLKVADPDPSAVAGSTVLRPYSEHMAGVFASVDLNEGYWVSPSNHKLVGIVGPERVLTWALNDKNTEANLLNEYGVTVVFKDPQSLEFQTWGNRNASFRPGGEEGINTFITTTRVADIINESIEYASKPFIDKPINSAIIDTITETVNGFLNKLIGQGAIVDGRCYFDANNNSNEEIANGHITFDYEFVPPPPAERITFRSHTNILLLSKLLNASA